jgi:hypothetical protein
LSGALRWPAALLLVVLTVPDVLCIQHIEQFRNENNQGYANPCLRILERKENMTIHKGMRFVSSMILMGALAAPLSLIAQDRDDHHDRDDHERHQRIYDRDHKDYHNWNGDEDRVYRQWYTESHNGRGYREYNKLKHKEQNAYWNWRHQHGDHDHDHDGHR